MLIFSLTMHSQSNQLAESSADFIFGLAQEVPFMQLQHILYVQRAIGKCFDAFGFWVTQVAILIRGFTCKQIKSCHFVTR